MQWTQPFATAGSIAGTEFVEFHVGQSAIVTEFHGYPEMTPF
jgi:hypothetical protein